MLFIGGFQKDNEFQRNWGLGFEFRVVVSVSGFVVEPHSPVPCPESRELCASPRFSLKPSLGLESRV